MKFLITAFALFLLAPQEPPAKPDAAALEAQYKTCAKHYIPADKCTVEIYQQLREKDSAPPDADTAVALDAANEYRTRLKSPESMQIRSAYLVSTRCKKCGPADRTVCLEVSAQNSFGGMTTDHVAKVTKLGKVRWLYDVETTGPFPIHSDAWDGDCRNTDGRIDLTEKVNQALKNAQ